ncbi:hypothetical protein L198_06432 [Cryptococcus wingfieldii CBS 7118]|uniref:Uncharacterized protein n=1 Tax=Cryptococcus wingfieldii CBS 7118 TaxID=1295528 RepID=A0A1E3IMK1_9TREE|nr:hypothetical protein L198_06432 [Cryptococcus wingfieldii CBS 7118]ODN89738.1 hypothetical protein L198_06432 [Cryptococcus wingfieldii CBS 7118]
MDTDPWADAPSTPPQPSSLPTLPFSPPDARTGTGSGLASQMGSPLKAQASTLEDVSGGFGLEDESAGAGDVARVPASKEETGEKNEEPPAVAEAEEDDGFDDFDDFNDSAPTPAANGSSTTAEDDDEGFGDFGNFEEGDFEEEEAPQETPGTGVMQEPESMVERWRALELRPPPPRSEIANQLSALFAPLLDSGKDLLTNEPPRAVGGLSQVLVGESSRDAYAQLTTPPLTKPLDWTRSRVRRDHLISLGVPVNLDEVDSHRLSSLPPLRITTSFATSGGRGRPQPRRAETFDSYSKSGDGDGRYTAEQKGKGRDQGPFSAAPGDGAGTSGKYGIGLRPEMDTPKAEELCGLEEDALSLLPLSTLRTLQQDLVTTSAQASATLAWMLQLKDAQTQDSATYNGMISSLIANAARARTAQQSSGGGVFRRSSTKVQSRPQSVSGNGGMTPRRVGSPGMW